MSAILAADTPGGAAGHRRGWRVATLIATLALLTACSTAPTPPQRAVLPPSEPPELSEEERWSARLERVAAMGDWRVRGKVAYRLPEEAGSASLDWRQARTQSHLRLSGPLGVGSTEIQNDGALLRVERDGIERLYPADAAPWLPGNTLLPVPVSSIVHWLRGVPDPTQAATLLETDNALARRIEQNGWEIVYDEYQHSQGLELPTRLSLSYREIQLSMKIILRRWER